MCVPRSRTPQAGLAEVDYVTHDGISGAWSSRFHEEASEGKGREGSRRNVGDVVDMCMPAVSENVIAPERLNRVKRRGEHNGLAMGSHNFVIVTMSWIRITYV